MKSNLSSLYFRSTNLRPQ